VWEDRSTHGTEFISASHAVELVRREPRRLRHGDRLFIGEAVLRFEQPSVGPEIPALTPPMEPPVEITGRQMDVLEELSRPLREPGGGAPASNAEICAALFITQNTLREHLGELYLRFGLTEDSGTSTQRRVRLAAAWRRARRR
jgi:DNA-binding CsgD family transcriptional regulator